MRLHSKVVEGRHGEKYIILFEQGKLDTPLCIISDHEWATLTSEVYDNMLNFGENKGD